MLTVGSLFTGIGGLDLGLERAGMTIIWQSEIDPFCCKVLAKHWPHVPNLGDITQVNWQTVEPVDVICGGYPCQPFSLAGSRQGSNDARHLWPHFADAIRVLRPRYALLENVAGHLSLGFDTVLGDLAEIGYDAQWDCIPAAAVGAPHLRDRLFAIATPSHNAADTDSGRFCGVAESHSGSRRIKRREGDGALGYDVDGLCVDVADTDGSSRRAARRASETLFRPETLERFRRRSSSLGHTWTVEPDVGRVANGIPARVDRLRALGNAVVPQVAQYIGEQIITHSGSTQ